MQRKTVITITSIKLRKMPEGYRVFINTSKGRYNAISLCFPYTDKFVNGTQEQRLAIIPHLCRWVLERNKIVYDKLVFSDDL